ncbi:hypothetical protein LguiB_030410 [Lonicera macranthoides]
MSTEKVNDSVSLDSVLQESLLHDWIVEVKKPAFQEDEAPQNLNQILESF